MRACLGLPVPAGESGKIYVSGDVIKNLAAAEREAGRIKTNMSRSTL